MIINDKRALAYTVTVDEIREIPGYDRVEHACKIFGQFYTI